VQNRQVMQDVIPTIMKDRNYSKQEIALYQLEKAIDLFLEGDDYISCITLAPRK